MQILSTFLTKDSLQYLALVVQSDAHYISIIFDKSSKSFTILDGKFKHSRVHESVAEILSDWKQVPIGFILLQTDGWSCALWSSFMAVSAAGWLSKSRVALKSPLELDIRAELESTIRLLEGKMVLFSNFFSSMFGVKDRVF